MAVPVYVITGVQAAGKSTAADAARAYREAGFTAVMQDVILGEHRPTMAAAIGEPVHVVLLDPEPEVVAAREAARPKDGGDAWTVATLVDGLRRTTPRTGQWIDTSDLTVEQTVAALLR